MLDEFYRVAFRKKLYAAIDGLQADLDDWVKNYSEERPPGSPPASRRAAAKKAWRAGAWPLAQ